MAFSSLRLPVLKSETALGWSAARVGLIRSLLMGASGGGDPGAGAGVGVAAVVGVDGVDGRGFLSGSSCFLVRGVGVGAGAGRGAELLAESCAFWDSRQCRKPTTPPPSARMAMIAIAAALTGFRPGGFRGAKPAGTGADLAGTLGLGGGADVGFCGNASVGGAVRVGR